MSCVCTGRQPWTHAACTASYPPPPTSLTCPSVPTSAGTCPLKPVLCSPMSPPSHQPVYPPARTAAPSPTLLRPSPPAPAAPHRWNLPPSRTAAPGPTRCPRCLLLLPPHRRRAAAAASQRIDSGNESGGRERASEPASRDGCVRLKQLHVSLPAPPPCPRRCVV